MSCIVHDIRESRLVGSLFTPFQQFSLPARLAERAQRA